MSRFLTGVFCSCLNSIFHCCCWCIGVARLRHFHFKPCLHLQTLRLIWLLLSLVYCFSVAVYLANKVVYVKPGPHQQQCWSNRQLCCLLLRQCCWCGRGLIELRAVFGSFMIYDRRRRRWGKNHRSYNISVFIIFQNIFIISTLCIKTSNLWLAINLTCMKWFW